LNNSRRAKGGIATLLFFSAHFQKARELFNANNASQYHPRNSL
jgi:hypothetical protein